MQNFFKHRKCIYFMQQCTVTQQCTGYCGPCGVTLVHPIKKDFILCIEQIIQDNSEFLSLKNILDPSVGYMNSLGVIKIFLEAELDVFVNNRFRV